MSKTVHIWMFSEEDSFWTDKIEFMYKPITITLLNLFNYVHPDIKVDYRYFERNKFENKYYDEINPNDTLIKVGWNLQQPYDILKEKGIYTVYFNTEPFIHKCPSDEVWTYSRQVYDDYEKNHDKQIIKFIPIICEENLPSVPYNLSNNNIDLVFLGKMEGFRTESESTYLKDKMKEVYNLWDDDAFNTYMKNEPRIFLSVKKDGTQALPSVRINKLLSYKSIVISTYTNKLDEELYNGMVYFCEIEEVEDIFRNLKEKSGRELQQLANEIYENFYTKFSFRNASLLIEER